MENYKIVGKPVPRKDALDKLTGSAIFGADVNQPGQLYAALYTSPWSYAKITCIDISEAKKVDGVKVILTGKDNLGCYGAFITDQPVFAVDVVRYEGEPVAAVAADTLEAALEAVKLIKVNYEVLTPVLTPRDALTEGSPILHDWSDYEMVGDACPIQGSNCADSFRLRRGDVAAGFAEADIIIDKHYHSKGIQHTTIEPHCSTAMYNSQGLTIWTPAQSPFMLRGQLAKLFKLNLNQVRLICTYVGGGFGSKYELRCEPIVAALAMKSKGRPVKLVLTRGEEFLLGGVRGPAYVHLKTGAKNDGTLVAYEIHVYYDTGAYTTTGPRITYNSGLAAGGPYNIPNVSVDAYTIVTNKQLTSAYRGFGVPEISWAYESQMDILAKELGMDPVELRLKNILHDGDKAATGEVLFSCGVKECLEEAARILDWKKGFKPGMGADGKLHGRGIAVTAKVTGTPSGSSVITKFNDDGTVTILQSGMEIGQGSNTTLPIIVAESMGLPLENVIVAPVDTMYTPYEKTTTGSRLTFHTGNSCLLACEDMKMQLITLAARHWKISEDKVSINDGILTGIKDSGTTISYPIKDIKKTGILHEREPITGRGAYSTINIFDKPDTETHQSKRTVAFWFWSAQGCEVEVDPETGKIEIVKFAAAHDIGKVINQTGAISQIEGSVMMGMGHALMEEMIYDDKSLLKNGNMVDFKIPTFKDAVPNLIISFIENTHPEGPFGAKGIGEPGLTPTAPALGNAIAQATGARLYTIPMKADDIFNAMNIKPENSARSEVR